MKNSFFLLLFLFGFCQLNAQHDRILALADSDQQSQFRADTFIFNLDDSAYLKFRNIFEQDCNPCNLRLVVYNPKPVTGYFIFEIRGHPKSVVWNSREVIPPIYQGDGIDNYLFSIPPFQTDTLFILHYQSAEFSFYARVFTHSKVYELVSKIHPVLFDQAQFFTYGFYSILFIIMLISLLYYLFLGNRHFIYYSIYIFFVLLLFYFNNTAFVAFFYKNLFLYNLSIWLITPVQAFFYIAYFGFVMLFLETRYRFPTIHRLIQTAIGVSVLFVLFILILFVLSADDTRDLSFNIYRLMMALLGIAMIIIMIGKKDRLVRLILIGSIFLLIGSLLTFYGAAYLKAEYMWGISRTYYMQMGVLIELVFFSMAVAYKTKEEVRQKIQYQQELQKAMQLNQQLAMEKEKDLVAKVAQAKAEITTQEEEKMKALLALKEKALEMQILRSQINPHFLFNSMNALKVFVHQNRPEEALRYFEKFSRLLRLILENTHERRVTLASELETLQLYVEIENLRLRHPVQLTTQIDPQIDTDFTMIPAMLLQPFVENAIWHGLSHREAPGGLIELHIHQNEEEALFIRIRDNGIGRQEAERYKSGTQAHKSLGTLITRQRLNLYNQQEGNVSYTDLFDDLGKAAGTEVKIVIQP